MASQPVTRSFIRLPLPLKMRQSAFSVTSLLVDEACLQVTHWDSLNSFSWIYQLMKYSWGLLINPLHVFFFLKEKPYRTSCINGDSQQSLATQSLSSAQRAEPESIQPVLVKVFIQNYLARQCTQQWLRLSNAIGPGFFKQLSRLPP